MLKDINMFKKLKKKERNIQKKSEKIKVTNFNIKIKLLKMLKDLKPVKDIKQIN